MDTFIALANRLADAARAIIAPAYRTQLTVEDKPDSTPVTAVDRAVETELSRLITRAFPGHGVIGEETPPHRPEAEYVWVIDPIDGTKAFVCGIPLFGTLIALTHRGAPILGVIDQPISRERWLGARGLPTIFNGAQVNTRNCPGLHQARLCATTPEMFAGEAGERFRHLAGQVKMTRYGADCYAYGLLASGFVDVVAEADLSPYDYLAHVPIIRGAGGVMTDWEGRELTLATRASRVVAAGDPTLHQAALTVLGR